MKKDISAQDQYRRMYPSEGQKKECSREITFCTTHRCSLRCFPKNTLIQSDTNSYIAIEDLRIGDEILGYIDNKIVKTKVTHIFINQDKLRLLSTEKSSIFTTDDHPFLQDDNVWKNAKDLKVQDAIKLYINDKIISDKIISNTLTDRFETVYNIETECHTFIANNFIVHNCTYCYQGCKENKDMSWETAKKIVDYLFQMYDEDKPDAFINKNTKQIILDFIGGEPLLKIDLMEQICDYFWSECIRRNHEWARTFMISMASNGTEYFNPECQKFFRKYRNHLSYSVSIDGPQEMHDACRVFPDGSGSFKFAYAAQQDYNKNFYNSIGTKATIARANLPYLSRLIEYYVNEGFESIHANCVYEEQWNYADAKLFYSELKKTADYLLSLDKEVELSLFEDSLFKPLPEEDNNNWCGGTGAMLGYDVDGKAYPCVRYMPASIGDISDKFVIGSAENGIYNDEKSKELLEELDNITRRSQSTDECFYCPIASGCSWCSAWNSQLFGTPNKRCTRICVMHKARSLANVYYWNKKYLKEGKKIFFHRYLPDEEALQIISNDELLLLNNIENEAKNNSNEQSNKLYIDEEKLREYLQKHNKNKGQNELIDPYQR